MYSLRGGCHCGNVHVEVTLSQAPATYEPRACDCGFCRKHGASYVSDSKGSLHLHVRNERALGRYRQGDELVDCLVCRNCGVLIGAVYRHDGLLRAALNSLVIDGDARFGESKPVSPRRLSASEKIERWENLWFADVVVRTGDA